MLLSVTKITQQSHQKVWFGSVEHDSVRLQCHWRALHVDHKGRPRDKRKRDTDTNGEAAKVASRRSRLLASLGYMLNNQDN